MEPDGSDRGHWCFREEDGCLKTVGLKAGGLKTSVGRIRVLIMTVHSFFRILFENAFWRILGEYPLLLGECQRWTLTHRWRKQRGCRRARVIGRGVRTCEVQQASSMCESAVRICKHVEYLMRDISCGISCGISLTKSVTDISDKSSSACSISKSSTSSSQPA